MKSMKIILFIIIGLVSSQVFSSPSLDKLRSDATAFWAAQKYEAYTATCIAIEKEEKSFAASFNIALGLFRSGSNNASLLKIEEIKREQKPTLIQVQRLDELKNEVVSYIRHIDNSKEHYKGSALLSKKQTVAVEKFCNGRSADCLGLKPDQVADFMEEENRLALSAMGYSVPVKHSSIKPE